MNDLISRKAAIEALARNTDYQTPEDIRNELTNHPNKECDWLGGIDEAISIIEELPTIDSPVKHGRWVENKYGYITCSVCDGFPLEAMTGSLITMHFEPYESEYCPHCGAKMDLEE